MKTFVTILGIITGILMTICLWAIIPSIAFTLASWMFGLGAPLWTPFAVIGTVVVSGVTTALAAIYLES